MYSHPVVLVHPSRLFSEALGSVLNNPPFRLLFVTTEPDSIPFGDLAETTLFVVGGRTPALVSGAIKCIKERLPSGAIVVIGDTNEPEALRMALEAGANAYLREAMTPKTLIRALELVLNDEIILPPEAAKYLPGHIGPPREVILREPQLRMYAHARTDEDAPINSNGAHPMQDLRLSARESDILQALIKGDPNKVIAQSLNITEGTVKIHVKAVLRKIRVKNRTQAAVWALKHPFSDTHIKKP